MGTFARLISIAGLVVGLVSCQAAPEIPITQGGSTSPDSTAAPAAAGGPVPPVALPLYGDEGTPEPVNLEVKVINETSESPAYTIKARTPYLTGSGSPYLAAFNQVVEAYTYAQISSFLQSLAESEDAAGLLQIDFLPSLIDQNTVSVLFKTTTYFQGTAHVNNSSHALNYDLQTGQSLALADLFQPGAPYLQALSDASAADLRARDALKWEEGALPLEENYREWNITPQGLLITFDEYRVDSYAAGVQSVLVPYDRLQAIARPDGPLSRFIQP